MVLLHFSCVTSSLWRCLLCCLVCRLSRVVYFFFFFKQKTAYEMRISDWSSDVCSSDLFQDGRTLSTVLFWLSCVMCLFMVYALSSWLTKLMASAGYSIGRSEEHTSELQSLMRISYAVFCLKKKNTTVFTILHLTSLTSALLLETRLNIYTRHIT